MGNGSTGDSPLNCSTTRRNWSIFGFGILSAGSGTCETKNSHVRLGRESSPVVPPRFARARRRALHTRFAGNGGADWLASGFHRKFVNRACSLGTISLTQLFRLLILVFATEY